MSLTNPNKPVTEARLQEFYHRIKNYLGFTEMPSEDMAKIVTPKPGVMSRRFKYSTEEQVVGEWIDGKPLYQKTIVFDNILVIQSNIWTNSGVPIGDIALIRNVIGFVDTVCVNCLLASADRVNTTIQLLSPRSGNTSLSGITIQYTKTTD